MWVRPPADPDAARTSCSPARSCTHRTRTPPSGSPSTCCRRCATAAGVPGGVRGECPDWMPFGQLHGIEVTGPLDDMGTVLDGRSVVIAPIRAGLGDDRRGDRRLGAGCRWWRRARRAGRRPRRRRRARRRRSGRVRGPLLDGGPLPGAAARLAANGRARYEAEFTWPGIGARAAAWLRRSDGEAPSGQARAGCRSGGCRRTTRRSPPGPAGRGRSSGAQRRRVEDVDVLERGPRLVVDDRARGRQRARRRRRPAARGVDGGVEGAGDARRGRPVGGAEAHGCGSTSPGRRARGRSARRRSRCRGRGRPSSGG